MKKQDLCIPFSNGTEFMIWTSKNCDNCKRSGCYEKYAIEKGTVTGYITFNVAMKIGLKSHERRDDGIRSIRLSDKCNNHNKPIIKKKRSKYFNHPKLF